MAADDIERGVGTVAIEKGESDAKCIAILTLRNKIGTLVFQGQLVKNVSKLIKKKVAESNKIQRMITVIGDKEEKSESGEVKTKKGLIKCTITFKEESDCEKFKESFKKVIEELPEIIKPH